MNKYTLPSSYAKNSFQFNTDARCEMKIIERYVFVAYNLLGGDSHKRFL